MNTLKHHKPFILLTLLCTSIVAYSQEHNPFDDNNPFTKLLKIYKENQPLVLDESIAYTSAGSPQNFNPTKLHSIADLKRPLGNGDYSVNVVFYCTQWCLHAPGKGVPYKLGRATGKMSKPISALLYEGTLKKINRKQLNSTAWKIQARIKFENMNQADHQLIDELIPQYKDQLKENEWDKILNDFQKIPLKTVLFNEAIKHQPPKIQKLGQVCFSLIAAQEYLNKKNLSPDQLSDKLFEHTSSIMKENEGLDDTTSRWIAVNKNIIARFIVDSGNLKDNLLEFRILNDAKDKPNITLNDIMEGSGDDEGESLMGYPIGQGAQIPIIEPDVDTTNVELIYATTTDAKSVSVDYMVSDSNAQQIQFDIFRSDESRLTNNSIKIGTATITDQEDISIGEHDNVMLISNIPLLPDTRMPFIIVVSNCKGETDTTHFQKWLLGAVAHGFDRYAMEGGWVWSTLFQSYELPPWEINMVRNLKQVDMYNEVIQFDWMSDCGIDKPGFPELEGRKLKNQIINWIISYTNHPGDVVDLHLIGHSRGTVVITQAINNLLNDPVGNGIKGSYIELTLLDPHPANNDLQKIWGNWGTPGTIHSCGFQGALEINIAKNMTTDFQKTVHDPYLLIPPGINSVDVWWQATDADKLCSQPDQEYIQNLWGMIQGSSIRNNSGLPIDFLSHAFTDKNILGIGYIGHNQVPLVYEKQAVESGTLNRSKQF